MVKASKWLRMTLGELELMRFIRLFNILAIGLLIGLYGINCFGQSAPSGDVVMVLPFENTSNRPEYNWVGESFADSLAELLNKPGLLVVSSGFDFLKPLFLHGQPQSSWRGKLRLRWL